MKLNGNLAIFIPSTININETIDNNEYVNLFVTIFSQEFGGATITQTRRCWYSDSLKELVKEDVTIVEAFGPSHEISEFFYNNLVPLAEKLRETLVQDCVAVRLNGTLTLV